MHSKAVEGTFEDFDYHVTYCYNCDGGGQERDTAVNAILEEDPKASVGYTVLSNYPIQTTIRKGSKIIWEDSQKNLFRKYASARAQSIEQIRSAVRNLLD